MATDVKLRGAPIGIQVSVWLMLAYAVTGVLTVIASFIVHGVSGSSIFTGTPVLHTPPASAMAKLLVIYTLGELVWLGAPLVLGLAVARGSIASRVAISIIAAVGLIVSVRWLASPLLFLPQLLLVVATVLFWIPSSDRHIRLQRQRSRRKKAEMDPLSWR